MCVHVYIYMHVDIVYTVYTFLNIPRKITYYISCAYGKTPLRTGQILPTLRNTT